MMITQGYELWAWVAEPGGGRITLPVVAWCDCDEQQLGRNGFHPVVARAGGQAKCLSSKDQRGATFGTVPLGGKP